MFLETAKLEIAYCVVYVLILVLKWLVFHSFNPLSPTLSAIFFATRCSFHEVAKYSFNAQHIATLAQSGLNAFKYNSPTGF